MVTFADHIYSKYYCGRRTTLSIGNVLPLRGIPEGAVVYNVEHHAGEQGDRSRWGMGFPQSYQLYSDFVLEILALRTCHEKRGKIQRMFAKITQRVFVR